MENIHDILVRMILIVRYSRKNKEEVERRIFKRLMENAYHCPLFRIFGISFLETVSYEKVESIIAYTLKSEINVMP